MRTTTVLALLLVSACGSGTATLDTTPEDGGSTGDGGATGDGGGVSDGGDGGTTGDGGTIGDGGGTAGDGGGVSDGGGTGDGGVVDPVEVSGLKASVHPDVKSIIVLAWTQSGTAAVKAEYSFDDGVWLESPTRSLEAGKQRQLLLGVPYGTKVTWRLLVDDTPAQDDATITTGTVPRNLPLLDDISGDESAWDPETKWILGSFAGQGTGKTWTFIVDRQGRPVWANQTPSGRTTFAPRPSTDGHEILIDYNSWWGSFDGGANSQVARLDIETAEIGRYETPGLIHPFTQTDDGTIAWSAAQGGTSYKGEVLATLDPAGTSETLFDCNTFSDDLGGDACGANAVTWNADTGNYLLSLYTLDTVIEISPAGEALRWFGQLSESWDFADADATFWWQHGAHYLEDGHLLLSARRTETAEETVAREYELDETAEELVQVWTFGEGEGVYAPILGEARRLGNGNTFHQYGSGTRMREVTSEGEVVWDASWNDTGTLGCTWPLSDLYAFESDAD